MPDESHSPPSDFKLFDAEVLEVTSHPTRAAILNFLSEGPMSPSQMSRRLPDLKLPNVCYHVDCLVEAGVIELVEEPSSPFQAKIYRTLQRQFFDDEEWSAIRPEYRIPIITGILRQISEDVNRSVAEGKFFRQKDDGHLSRAPVELDDEGWSEVVDALNSALYRVLEAHDNSLKRSRESGERDALMPYRTVIMQFPIGREPIANTPQPQTGDSAPRK